MGRVIPNTMWSRRPSPGQDVMEVIITGFWDDLASWEDNKTWYDSGESAGAAWTARTQPAIPSWN